MKKALLCLMAVLCVCVASHAAHAESVPTQAKAYDRIVAMKAMYPEGKVWTNASRYASKSGSYSAGGCMGFAYLMSDAAFGSAPMRDIYPSEGKPITIAELRVGDILRLPGHSVVVLEKHGDYITVTEGNYQRKVHWGRKITAAQVKKAKYYTTRYPEGYTEPETVPVVVNGTTYHIADISGHWAKEHIKACLTSSLLSVTGNTERAYFMPNENATRAQVVTALYRAKGSPAENGEVSFADATEEWYRPAVSWASSNGIVTGVTSASFAPNQHVTREQLAVILYRYANAKEESTDLSAYSDKSSVSPFAAPAVSWAVKNNIISGKNGLLLPQGKTTRAEFATMIVRFSSALSKA